MLASRFHERRTAFDRQVQRSANVEPHKTWMNLSPFDARYVTQIIDQKRHVLDLPLGECAQPLLVFWIVAARAQDPHRALDGCERAAQLVSQDSEELGLSLAVAGGFCSVLLVHLLGSLAVGHVDRHAREGRCFALFFERAASAGVDPVD